MAIIFRTSNFIKKSQKLVIKILITIPLTLEAKQYFIIKNLEEIPGPSKSSKKRKFFQTLEKKL